jgi:AsmA family
MSRTRKYGRIVLLVFAILIVVQVGVSFLVKTHRIRRALIAGLESAFGRPVEADDFSVQLLPMPEVDIDRVTIGEDPAFGREYFLRADRMTARLRWLGLLPSVRHDLFNSPQSDPGAELRRPLESGRLVASGAREIGRNGCRPDCPTEARGIHASSANHRL